MAKRGRKRKNSALEKIVGKQEEVEKLPVTDALLPDVSENTGSFLQDDREAMYDKFDGIEPEESKEVVKDNVEEIVEDVIKEEPDATAEEVELAEASAETEEITETSTETEEAEKTDKTEYVPESAKVEPKTDVKVKPEEIIKTVPLSALHEERAKRKELAKKIAELEKTAPSRTSNEEDEYRTDEERRLIQLENRINDLDKREQERVRYQEISERDQAVNDIDTYLAKKGINGFKEVGQDMVKRYLLDKVDTDPDYVDAHDNPEGWAKIYSEIYPDVRKIFREQERKEAFDKKNADKAQANLVNTVGKKVESKKKKEEKLTPEQEYMQERAKTLI